MKTYIGAKIINAKPMTRAEYNEFRGWTLPANENGADEGFLVEYTDGGKANTPHFAGYVSWSPAGVFAKAYKASGSLSFGAALEALKAGRRVARAGWNGKDMWLSLSCDGSREVPIEGFWSPHNAEHARQQGGKATVLPAVTLKTAGGEIMMGWTPNGIDMLAEDWMVLADEAPAV